MLFLPSTTISNIKLNVQIVLSLAIFVIGLALSAAQIVTDNDVINSLNLTVGLICTIIGLLSMYSASKGKKMMMPVLLFAIYGLLTFILFQHTDATKSSPIVLCGYIALIALVSFKYRWSVSLGAAVLCTVTLIVRLILINGNYINVVIGDNPMWLNSVINLMVIIFICIIAGYYGYEMNKFATNIAANNEFEIGNMVSEHTKHDEIVSSIKKIDEIYLSHASIIDDIIIKNEDKLNPENEVSYEELLQIGNEMSEAVDKLLKEINKNI